MLDYLSKNRWNKLHHVQIRNPSTVDYELLDTLHCDRPVHGVPSNAVIPNLWPSTGCQLAPDHFVVHNENKLIEIFNFLNFL